MAQFDPRRQPTRLAPHLLTTAAAVTVADVEEAREGGADDAGDVEQAHEHSAHALGDEGVAAGHAARAAEADGEASRLDRAAIIDAPAAAREARVRTAPAFGRTTVVGVTASKTPRARKNVARGADRADDTPRSGRFLKRYTVFNIDQIDGLEDRYPGPIERPAVERIAAADAWLAATGAEIRIGGDLACYRPDADTVHMPHIDAFADAEAYYAVLAHELIHYAVSWIMPHGRVRRLTPT